MLVWLDLLDAVVHIEDEQTDLDAGGEAEKGTESRGCCVETDRGVITAEKGASQDEKDIQGGDQTRHTEAPVSSFRPNSQGVQVINFSGRVSELRIPDSGVYHISVKGAQGGSSYRENSETNRRAPRRSGGAGAVVSADFVLTAGTTLVLCVGGMLPSAGGGLSSQRPRQKFAPYAKQSHFPTRQ